MKIDSVFLDTRFDREHPGSINVWIAHRNRPDQRLAWRDTSIVCVPFLTLQRRILSAVHPQSLKCLTYMVYDTDLFHLQD